MTAAFIEAAYRFDLPADEHLRELARAGAASFATKDQVATIAFEHLTDEQTVTHIEVGRGDDRIVRTIGRAAQLLTPSERQQTMTLTPAYRSCSGLFGASNAVIGFREDGYADIAGLMCLTGPRSGIVVCAAYTEPKRVKPNERRYFHAASMHVASAWRLRHALARDQAIPDAVLHPDGRPVHLRGALTARSARARLQEAVRQRERSRSRRAREDMPGFPALLAGTWTLADRFESDGRRYVVAYRLADDARDGLLTDEAQRALARAVEGAANKVIALELGVSEATVSRLIARALETLRFSDLREAMLLAKSAPAWLVDGAPPLCVFRLADQPPSELATALTPAERDIARRVVSGATRASIARARGTSISTVDSQLVALYAKLRVGSRRGLLKRFIDE